MKVTKETVDPGLWRRGTMLRRMGHDRSVEDFHKNSRLMKIGEWALTRRKLTNVVKSVEFIPRPDGSRLRILVLVPLSPKPDAAGLLWIHGGGYAGGSPDTEALIVDHLSGLTGCVTVSPDYRLSTEAPYPAALDDCMLALQWLKDNAARLGARTDQLAVAGASAGGGLTAAVTLRARDEGRVAIAFQAPIYPMIDDRCVSDSARENDAPVWDAVTNRNAWKLYLGPLSGGDVPAYAAPARATDYSGLPPTMTYVGDQEPFLDETLAYVEALKAAGVEVQSKVFPGAWHGFDVIAAKAGISRQAQKFRDDWFRHAVATYTAEQPG